MKKTALFLVIAVVLIAINVLVTSWVSAPISNQGWFAGALEPKRLLVNLAIALIGLVLAFGVAAYELRKEKRQTKQTKDVGTN